MTLSHLLFVKVMTWVVYWTDTQQVNTCLFEVLTAVFLKKTEKKPLKLRKNYTFSEWLSKTEGRCGCLCCQSGMGCPSLGHSSSDPGAQTAAMCCTSASFHSQQYHPEEHQEQVSTLVNWFFFIYIYNTTLHQVILTILISGWKFTTSVRDREKFRAQNASNSQLNNKKYISTAMVSFMFTFLALFSPALLHFSS